MASATPTSASASVPAPEPPPSFHSTNETTNYARLCRLLVGIGTEVLRETFDRLRPSGKLDVFLSSHSVVHSLQMLRKRKILNPAQWGKLYPAMPSSVSSRDFDITLLMVLLRSICGLAAPATGWDNLPFVEDTSTVADVIRLRLYRNTVYGHASSASVDKTTFETYWSDIKKILVRLGGPAYETAIDKLGEECMDPDVEEHYQELLRQWVKDEDCIKDKLDDMAEKIDDLRSRIKEVNEKLDALPTPKEETGDGGQSADRSISSLEDHATALRSTEGNSPITTLNSMMSATINPVGSGSTSAVFAGAQIGGSINVNNFNVYQAPAIIYQNANNSANDCP